jgi:tetratricopeptide (TPR) repeat protein
MAEGTSVRICPNCGKEIPEGRADCPQCSHRLEQFLHARETVLFGSLLVIVVLSFITGAVARGYHLKLHALAGQWFNAGEKELNTGNAEAALADLRNALVYEPEDPRIEFRLAQALIANERYGEAQSYLLGLLAHSPSDAEVNLALARIAAGAGNETDALRYYHGAVYGVWQSNPEENRLNARVELCRFLIVRNDDTSADGELMALEAEIPQQHATALHAEAGELFLRAGDASRALEEFRRALSTPHPPTEAWRGAGLAAYQMGDFRQAQRYLERAYREKKDDADVAAELGTTRLMLAWDPEARGLTEAQRRERVRHDLAQAISLTESCAKSSGIDLSKAPEQTTGAGQNAEANQKRPAAPSGDLATEYAQATNLQGSLSDRNLSRHPEELDAAINMIFTLELTASQKCGEPTGLDEALVILGKHRQNREQ